MSQAARQRELFAGEDFRIIYDTFRQQNFVAYDYQTIKTTLIEYLRNQYPENFNDWIQSSEFIAIIETLAFLTHSLAFRIDLASRENFLSTAERRESVIRIAEFLGYTPKRHFPSRGFLKVKNIRTTQNVYDINGETLKNETVDFETEYQNFLLVLNEVLSSSNKFGSPTDSVSIGNVRNDIYKTNITEDRDVVFEFSGNINGSPNPFEIHGVRINSSTKNILEVEPDPLSSFDILYKNDNQGLTSPNTGFFVGFKQGELEFLDFDTNNAIPNLSIDIEVDNINDSDIWVQELDNDGNIQNSWIKVDSNFGYNNVFNAISSNERNLYTVKTLDDDRVSVIFGDGVFSNIPKGIIRIWYRRGANLVYTLEPEDIGTVTFSFDYDSLDNNTYTVSFEVELEEIVNNSSTSETIESIKQNAGRVNATQDRMVTAEDYSVYPLTVSENIKKIKAINRVYTGQSQFIKHRDPTAQYQNVDIIGTDGYFYVEQLLFRNIIDHSEITSSKQLLEQYIVENIKQPEVVNLFYNEYDYTQTETVIEWQQISSGYRQSTGFFINDNSDILRLGKTSSGETKTINTNSIIEFSDSSGNKTWARVLDIVEEGLGVIDNLGNPTGKTNRGFGSVILNKVIPNNATVTRIFPSYRTIFSSQD